MTQKKTKEFEKAQGMEKSGKNTMQDVGQDLDFS